MDDLGRISLGTNIFKKCVLLGLQNSFYEVEHEPFQVQIQLRKFSVFAWTGPYMRPSLRHEKHRFFLFSRLDLVNRTDPDEAVRNVEYMM